MQLKSKEELIIPAAWGPEVDWACAAVDCGLQVRTCTVAHLSLEPFLGLQLRDEDPSLERLREKIIRINKTKGKSSWAIQRYSRSHSLIRCDAIIRGTCEDVGRTPPKAGRGAEGLMAFGMFWKSAEKTIKIKSESLSHKTGRQLDSVLTLRADTLRCPARAGAELCQLTGGIVCSTILSLWTQKPSTLVTIPRSVWLTG